MQDLQTLIDRYFYLGGFNCAETTFTILHERGHLDVDPDVVRLMTGFGGGMSKGYVCGAVAAAVAAIGSRYGRTSPQQDREPSKRMVLTYLENFTRRYPSVNCTDLIRNYTAHTAEQYDHCKGILRASLEAFEETMEDEAQRAK